MVGCPYCQTPMDTVEVLHGENLGPLFTVSITEIHSVRVGNMNPSRLKCSGCGSCGPQMKGVVAAANVATISNVGKEEF